MIKMIIRIVKDIFTKQTFNCCNRNCRYMNKYKCKLKHITITIDNTCNSYNKD